LGTQAATAHVLADFATATECTRRRLGLAPQLNDPDHLALIQWDGATAALGRGDFDDAEIHALRHDAIARRLTPHHEVHAIGGLLTLDEAAGCSERLNERTERTQRAG